MHLCVYKGAYVLEQKYIDLVSKGNVFNVGTHRDEEKIQRE